MSAIQAARPIDLILSTLHEPRRAGAGWTSRCPAHDDRRASLTVRQGEDGRVLLHCHAGCATEDVLQAVGLTMADLFVPRPEPAPTKAKGRLVATYDYRDEAGALLYQAVRYEPKDFLQRRPDGAGGWIWSMAGVRRVLYRLPEVLAKVAERKTVCIAEGEKDCDNLFALGIVATTNVGGAGKWLPEYSEVLRGARVLILPDNDQPGRRHGEAVARALQGIAAEVKILELPGLPAKGDVSDWIAAGGTAVDLGRLTREAPVWDPARAEEEPGETNSEESVDSERDPEPWDEPVSLDGAGSLPGFPTDALPARLRSWVTAEAIALQVPPDLPAMLALSVCAAAVARRVSVRVRDGWTEPANLYTVTALPPGERKSAVFADATHPVEEYEADEARRMAPEIAEAAGRYRMAEAARDRAEAAAAAAKTAEDRATRTQEAGALARDLTGLTVPALPRLVTADCTPEALASLLAEQGGRMAVMAPEGDTFDLMAGRYSGGKANLGVYLLAHAGDTLRVDRRGRAEYVKSPALTIGLAVQPDVLRGLQTTPGVRGRGLLGRFLYAMPTSLVGHRDTHATPMPGAVRAAYERGVLALLTLAPGTDAEGQPVPHVLTLTPGATAEIDAFAAALEPRLAPGADLGAMTDWAGKLVGAVARIAGVLHCVEHAGEAAPYTVPVTGGTMRAAVRLGRDYLIPHAQAAYGLMGADPVLEGARRILTWLRDAGAENFTKRDAHAALRATFERADDLNDPLRVLEERGYIRALPAPEHPGRGRKPSPAFAVNPATHNRHNPQNRAAGVTECNPVDCVDSVENVAPPEGALGAEEVVLL